MKIFIVEDEKIIADSIKEELEKWGYEVDIAKNFENITKDFKEKNYNLVLLDIVLPYLNGYYWCQEIRKISDVPVIFISSKSEDMDIVMALQFGADDYITKPVNTDIIIAKVKAVLRRAYSFSNFKDVISYKGFEVDISKCMARYKENEIDLTKTQLQIITELVKNQTKVSSRDSLIDKCWQSDNFIDDNTLAVNISRLRKKLSSIGLNDFIITKKGIGYYLSDEI